MLFSVIVPVYNRPEEIDELLDSLLDQTYTGFEVLIIEDGSELRCRDVVERYGEALDIRYYYKENSGQGFSRNYGFERAKGDYMVVFDSDCIIPDHYFRTVHEFLVQKSADAWGGPDRAHPAFTPIQQAISYAMTSPLTTGGIRGRSRHIGTFHPRSFNMGISREVYQSTGGYRITRMGEDLEFSIRIIEKGFKTVLIEDAYVFHKRRTDFRQFCRQLFFFGRARINVYRFHPDELKTVHMLPALFVIGLVLMVLLVIGNPVNFWPLVLPLFLYACILLVHSFRQQGQLALSLLSVIASFVQLTAYGAGFLKELFHYLRTRTKG